MRIVIAGAGGIGFHLAKLLSSEKQDIILIDQAQDVLDYAKTHLDVFTILGDSSSLEILQNAEINKSKLLLAVTTSEKNNLITAILAKKLGAKQTIARVSNFEYLNEDQRKNFAELGVDYLLSPTQLAAKEIERLVLHCEVTDNFDFEGGKFTLNGIVLDDSSSLINKTINNIDYAYPNIIFKPIAILRGSKTIIPRGDTTLRHKDHIYFLTRKEKMNDLLRLIGKELMKIKNVMILGSSPLAFSSAKLLENKYNVTIVAAEKESCKYLAENLKSSLIIQGEPDNIDLLKEEGLKNTDAFLALTPNSESNIISSLMAERAGVFKTIALVDNMDYTQISQNIGVDTLINKKLIAANNIFRFVRKGKIEAITTPHGVDAEIIEFTIHKKNQLTKKPLKDLHFPENCIIGGVIRGEQSIVPNGEFQLQVDDKIIVFALPQSISKVVKLFG